MVDVAVKITVEPEHTGFDDGEIKILTGAAGITAMVMALDVAVVFATHDALEVSSQVIASLFAGAYE